MKKTLIALAVAGVVAAPAAMADVTVYGQGHVSIGTHDNGDKSVTAVDSNSSRIGFKAAESLDGGLTAVAQMEFGVNMDTVNSKGDVVTARNQFVGLAGGFGTILAGRHDAPLKMSTGALDVFADTVADYNGIVGVNGATDVRADNAIAYVAPAIGGATIVLAYVPDENAGTDKSKGEELAATSAAVMWGQGPLSVDLGYLSASDLPTSAAAGGAVQSLKTAGGDPFMVDATDIRVGVGYAVSDALKIGFVYDTVEFKKISGIANTATLKFTDYLVNAAFNMGGGNTLKAEYGNLKGDSGNALANGTTTMYAVGLDHAFSKNTSGYVVYAAMQNDDKMGMSLGVVGSGANITAAAGKDPSSIQVGMVVKF